MPSEYGILGTCEDALFLNNMKYAFATIRNYGVISLNITDIKNPSLAGSLYTRGGEGIALLKN